MLDRIEIRALPPSKRTTARWTPGDSCMAVGACKILQNASLGIGTGQLQNGASAYDVGRGSITGAIARLSVGAAMFARAMCHRHLHRP